VSDFVFLLITAACFAALALLVGLLDRRLGEESDQYDDERAHEPAGVAR